MKSHNPPLRAGRSFAGKRTFLAQNGLHARILDYVMKNPGKPLKSAAWAQIFKCNPSTCRKIAAAIETDLRRQGWQVPERERGGLNNPNGHNQTMRIH